MKEAIILAESGRGRTSPNPLVGALIVKNGAVIGRGAHEYVGGNHAEVNALNQAGDRARGAAMICTLEPCTHYGKTPPCVDAIIQAGIIKVDIGALDPNPVVCGNGVKILRDNGIVVNHGILEEEVKKQNAGYFSLMEKGRPLFIAKTAQTLNGRITMPGRRWLTGAEARKRVHEMRAEVDAVMVGVGTVLSDDPRLTVRDAGCIDRQPTRVVLDTNLRIPDGSNIMDGMAPTLIYCGEDADKRKTDELQCKGIEVIRVRKDDTGLLMDDILEDMAVRGFLTVMVEGGSQVMSTLLSKGLIDVWKCFIIPEVVLDASTVPLVPLDVREASFGFKITEAELIGKDMLLTMETIDRHGV